MFQKDSSPTSPNSANKETPDPLQGDYTTVLLAVDEPSIGRMLVRVITQAGLKVFWVRDLAEGLGWLRDHNRDVAVAFLDCHQTDTESRVFCRCARNIKPGLPVMLAGGAEAKAVVEDISVDGLSTLVTKPYLPTELTWQLRAQIRRTAA
jgi:DNA-binding response OmpR family regulator